MSTETAVSAVKENEMSRSRAGKKRCRQKEVSRKIRFETADTSTRKRSQEMRNVKRMTRQYSKFSRGRNAKRKRPQEEKVKKKGKEKELSRHSGVKKRRPQEREM